MNQSTVGRSEIGSWPKRKVTRKRGERGAGLVLGGLMFAYFVGVFAVPICTAETAERPPNFIVVYCDNLGYGDIEPFGSTLHRTPRLNQMAREGRKFTHFCVTAGVCTPSRASIMTGCYSQRVAMHNNDRDGWVLRPVSPYGLNPDELTIAEVLKTQGYATAIIGKWHLGDQPAFLPTRQGFDWFFGVPYSDDMTERVWTDGSKWPPLPLMENETVVEAPCDRNGLTKRYTEKAIDWISQHREEPFFLYFPQAMPGSTKTPFSSPEFRGKSKNGPWGDSIEELDWSMGAILDHLNDLNLAEDTLVIWTSDNGAPINRDRSDLSRGSNLPLHGRGYTTAEGAFRVPTIVWQPGRVPADTVCDQLATTMDLLPTFAGLAGAELPKNRLIDGHNVANLFYGDENEKTPYEAFYYYQQEQLQAVRSGRWKWFPALESWRQHPHFRKGAPSTELLFDVESDVACQNNVAEQHPDVIRRMRQLAERARADLGDEGRPGAGQRPIGRIAEPEKATARLLISTDSATALDALDVIESTRGGRHWADEKTAPSKTPHETLKSFRIEDGYQIELFAAEPLVMDPVAIAFDHNGRMFAVEYGDYPIGPPDGGKPLSRIVLLEDTDGDARADRRTVFADGLDFAHSLMPYRGGLLVGAKTEILYLKDTDGDDKADFRKVMFDGFTPAHPQMQIGNPRWGIDNWIYLNYGPGNVRSAAAGGEAKAMPRKDFRFDPQTLAFEADSGLGQFGNTVDRWGRRFYCTNRNPIMTSFLSPAELALNPYHTVVKPYYDVSPSGGESKVYPLVTMKSNYLSHAGTHTSACGTTAYLGDLGDDSFADSVFVCEPIGHLVTRSIVQRDGVKLHTRRAEEKSDFLASTDTWFRPASLATGPDGALYLADMYRLWVEHPKFLPPEIAAKLDWRAGDDLGRIYRITPKGATADPYTAPSNVAEQVALLESKNGWRQYLGQRLLVENQDASAEAALRQLLSHPRATTRLHAMWTLEGLGVLRDQDLMDRLSDEEPRVRAGVLELFQRRAMSKAMENAALQATHDADEAVRMRAAIALAGTESEAVTESLARLATEDGEDSGFADALLTASKMRSGIILSKLFQSKAFLAEVNSGKRELVQRLASIVGVRGDVDEMNRLCRWFGAQDASSMQLQFAAIGGFASGLARYRGDLGRLSVSKLMVDPPKGLEDSAETLKSAMNRCVDVALNASADQALRTTAISLLGYRSFAGNAETFSALLSSERSEAIQTAAVAALSRNGAKEIPQFLLDRWRDLRPTVRQSALSLLLRRTESTLLMLKAMGSDQVSASGLSIDQRVRLLKHRDETIRELSEKLFGGAVSSNRMDVAKRYEASLSLPGSASKGHEVFKKVCASCHRLGGEGKQVGPDLTDVANRSKAALLYDILDPNSKVEPRFQSYVVLTDDGNVTTGLLASENSETIVLHGAEGKLTTIGRGQIEDMKSSEVSLMPEGIEKDVSVEQMADLLSYLTRR